VTAYTHADYFSKSLADADPDIFKGIRASWAVSRSRSS
jgi:hypothetical protein